MLATAGGEDDLILEPGMTLAIEPLLAARAAGPVSGAYAEDSCEEFRSTVADDGWTVLSVDGWLTCHFEHTVAVTDRGVETLTAA